MINNLKKCYKFNRLYRNYLPCIKLLKWGVYCPPIQGTELQIIEKKVTFVKTISGFYALYIRESTVNDKKRD